MATPRSAQALDIVYVNAGSVGTQMMTGFEAAATILENLLTDNVTVRINVAASSGMSNNILAQTSTARVNYSYATTYSALLANVTSTTDQSSTSHLQAGNAVAMVTNLGTPTRVYDNNASNNNSNVLMTTANAKALGLFTDIGAIDATVSFNSNFSYDYDSSNGVSGYDFVGIALHEIATALGFMSGIDTIDMWTRYGMSTDNMAILSTLDLFRYSSASLAYGEDVIDAAVGGASYFSVDGGVTNESFFSTGSRYGNGYQASRWAYGSGGIMAPTAAYGQAIAILPKDILALDTIGWEVAPAQLNDPGSPPNGDGSTSAPGGTFSASAVPEPGTILLLSLGLGILGLTSGGLARARR